VISTGDKDLAQLVNHHVTLINTMSNETLDEAGVLAKFGVPPERIVDYLALVGDTVDGVPGVNKVGPKTAVKWLTQYGSLDGVTAHASDIGGAVGENLRQHLDFLPLGKKLVTVVCDLDLPVAITELIPQPPDTAKLIGLFTRLEFKGWLKELGASGKTGTGVAQGDFQSSKARNNPLRAVPPEPTFNDLVTTEPDRSNYACILDATRLDTWLDYLNHAELVALDTETTGLNPMQAQLVGISFAFNKDDVLHAAYLPLGHNYAGVPTQLPLADALEKLRPWLESPHHHKLGQHLKYDRHIFANHGVQLAGIVEDTLLESYVLESG
jgi:DNA polymerase-1